jgi:hypothetical protein
MVLVGKIRTVKGVDSVYAAIWSSETDSKLLQFEKQKMPDLSRFEKPVLLEKSPELQRKLD